MIGIMTDYKLPTPILQSGPTGATKCVVITDRLTKGVILVGMKNTTAEDVA
jgi:hypothetical protein